jgi:hypothetical protein
LSISPSQLEQKKTVDDLIEVEKIVKKNNLTFCFSQRIVVQGARVQNIAFPSIQIQIQIISKQSNQPPTSLF